MLFATSLTLAIACGGKAESVAGSGGSGSGARAGSSGAPSAGAPAGGTAGDVDAGSADNGQGGAPCSLPCPDPFSSILVVVTADGGGPVNDAQATLINAEQGAPVSAVMLSCTAQATRTVCLPALSTAPPGEYLLEVTAPSFQENVIAVRLVWLPPNDCGCAFAVLQPAT